MAQATWDVITGATAPGGVFCPAVEDALEAAHSNHAGATVPTYALKGMTWYDETNDAFYFYDGTSSQRLFVVDETNHRAGYVPDEITFTSLDASPLVTGVTSGKVNNLGATHLAGFDGGKAGQILHVRFNDANTTVDGLITKTGQDIETVAGDTMVWRASADGVTTGWDQIGGSIGMGAFVPIIPGVAVTDWPAASVVAAADVDFSKDSVRPGALEVYVVIEEANQSGTGQRVYARKNGTATTGNTVLMLVTNSSALTDTRFARIPVDNDAIAEVWSAADWSGGGSTFDAWVHGYWI